MNDNNMLKNIRQDLRNSLTESRQWIEEYVVTICGYRAKFLLSFGPRFNQFN